MRITVKRALKLRKELETLLSKTDLPLTVDMSVFVQANRDEPLAAVSLGSDFLAARLARSERLSGILCGLRIGISVSNVQAEIERLLAGAADIDRRIVMQKAVADAPESGSEEHLKGELGLAFRNLHSEERARSYMGTEKTVSVSVVTGEMRAAARRRIADLRREKEALDDARVAANAREGIEIADVDAELLREIGVL